MTKVHCGEDFCETCGDCLACYGDDPCGDGGEHSWPNQLPPEEDTQDD